MQEMMVLDAHPNFVEMPADPAAAPKRTVRGLIGTLIQGIGSGLEWLFGVASLILGLSILAALPLLQFLSMGYLLEASGRVASSGRLRDGLIGVRKAARVGSSVTGIWLMLWPAWLVQSYASSAELIDPGGPVARGWRRAAFIVISLFLLHIFLATARGGRLRYYLWPFGNPLWMIRRLRRGGLYTEARDGLWTFTVSLHLPRYFRLGLLGFLGTVVWILPPAFLIAAGAKTPVLGVIGMILLAIIVPFLPFLQVHYAVQGRISAMFSRCVVREHFRRAPWAFAFALMVLLVASIPLYLLKLEMIPREAAWLPSLVFVIFLAPARLLTGWAYSRSLRRERPRHWFFRILGRLAIVPVALLYVLVVFLSQYTSWAGVGSLYEQHAFLMPAPFLSM